MRGNISGAVHFPAKGGKALNHRRAIHLVRMVKPGYAVPGNVERHGSRWVLRATFNRPEGGCIRRGIVLPGEDTALVASHAIVQYRKLWRDECRGRVESDSRRARLAEVSREIARFSRNLRKRK